MDTALGVKRRVCVWGQVLFCPCPWPSLSSNSTSEPTRHRRSGNSHCASKTHTRPHVDVEVIGLEWAYQDGMLKEHRVLFSLADDIELAQADHGKYGDCLLEIPHAAKLFVPDLSTGQEYRHLILGSDRREIVYGQGRHLRRASGAHHHAAGRVLCRIRHLGSPRLHVVPSVTGKAGSVAPVDAVFGWRATAPRGRRQCNPRGCRLACPYLPPTEAGRPTVSPNHRAHDARREHQEAIPRGATQAGR